MARPENATSDLAEKLRQHIASEIANGVGIYCLSEDRLNILMWTHYANSHKGYCLEFAPTRDSRLTNAARVHYASGYPTIGFFTEGPSAHLDKALLTKHREWGYEREWRVIDVLHGEGVRQLTHEALVSVTVGLSCPQRRIADLQTWNATRSKPVPLFRAVRDLTRFQLNLESL